MTHSPSSELILVRHGETLGESSIRLNGITDVGLSPLGERQMLRVRDALSGESFDRVLSSPLLRSRQSNALVYPDLEPAIIPAFREINFGDWETWTWAEVRERDPQGYDRWERASGDFQFPGGDSRFGFTTRIAEATRDHLLPTRGKTLAVLHKGVIKTAVATLLDLDRDTMRALHCELGSIHRLRRVDGRWEPVAHNQLDHLGDARISGSH